MDAYAASAVALLVALLAGTSIVAPASPTPFAYADQVGPAAVWGRGSAIEGKICNFAFGSSIENGGGPLRVVTTDRLPGCGNVRVWVYEEPASDCDAGACPTSAVPMDEIRAHWQLVAGPVDVGPDFPLPT